LFGADLIPDLHWSLCRSLAGIRNRPVLSQL
jgi:hypothetical protein